MILENLTQITIDVDPSTFLPAVTNPLDGVVPDFSIFGAKFNTLWKKLLGGVWAIGMLASIFYLIRGLVSMNQHQSGGHPTQLRESRNEVKTAAISLAGLAGLATIVGAILTVMG